MRSYLNEIEKKSWKKNQSFWITVFLNFQQEMGLKDRVVYTFLLFSTAQFAQFHMGLWRYLFFSWFWWITEHRMTESWNAVQFLQEKHTQLSCFCPRGVGGLYTGIQTVNANVLGASKMSLFPTFIPSKKTRSPLWKVPFNLHICLENIGIRTIILGKKGLVFRGFKVGAM